MLLTFLHDKKTLKQIFINRKTVKPFHGFYKNVLFSLRIFSTIYTKFPVLHFFITKPNQAAYISTSDNCNNRGRWKVSMPSNGLHPFLRYPSATPVKSRLCRGILVNNSQNILISSIFALFFWLFNSALWYYDIMEKSNIIYPNFPPIK